MIISENQGGVLFKSNTLKMCPFSLNPFTTLSALSQSICKVLHNRYLHNIHMIWLISGAECASLIVGIIMSYVSYVKLLYIIRLNDNNKNNICYLHPGSVLHDIWLDGRISMIYLRCSNITS